MALLLLTLILAKPIGCSVKTNNAHACFTNLAIGMITLAATASYMLFDPHSALARLLWGGSLAFLLIALILSLVSLKSTLRTT